MSKQNQQLSVFKSCHKTRSLQKYFGRSPDFRRDIMSVSARYKQVGKKVGVINHYTAAKALSHDG